MYEKDNIRLLPYVLIFSAIYAILIIVAGAVATVFGLDSTLGLSVGALVLASAVAGQRFTAAYQRKMERREIIRLSLYPLFATIGISILYSVIFVLVVGGTRELQGLIGALWSVIWMTSAIMVGVALLHFLMILMGYGWVTNCMYSQLNKKKSRPSL